MKSKKLLLIVSLVLALTMSLGGTLAYLTDTDSEVNVMELGNVSIEQHEMKRPAGMAHYTGPNAPLEMGDLVEFTDGIQLYPAYPVQGETNPYSAEGSGNNDSTYQMYWGDYVHTGTASNGLWNDNKLIGAVDKFVFIENTGTSDAYFRTIIAFEHPEGVKIGEPSQGAHIMINDTGSQKYGAPSSRYVGEITVSDVRYAMYEYIYADALLPGEWSHPSLLQVVMTHHATNKEMELLGKTYEILVFTQAMQTKNFEGMTAGEALDIAFGDITTTNHPWTNGVEVKSAEGVIYAIVGDTATVSAADGDTIVRYALSDGYSDATNVVVSEGITTLGNRAFRKSAVTTISLPSTLTRIEDSAFQQSAITSIEVPENVTFIGQQAFGSCPDLEKIVIKAKNVTFDALDEYNNPNNPNLMYTARDCAKLKEVYIYSDTVTFSAVNMPFTNKQTGDVSGITFYVSNQAVADALYNAYNDKKQLLIKSIDGTITYYAPQK